MVQLTISKRVRAFVAQNSFDCHLLTAVCPIRLGGDVILVRQCVSCGKVDAKECYQMLLEVIRQIGTVRAQGEGARMLTDKLTQFASYYCCFYLYTGISLTESWAIGNRNGPRP